MSSTTFTITEIMDILVAYAGLPESDRTDDGSKKFSDIGLDSLAFLQLQTLLDERYGLELPTDRPQDYTFADITAFVSARLAARAA